MTGAELIERIKKLKALEESNRVGEAAAAAAKVQQLLAEHNLTLLDLETEKEPDYINKGFTGFNAEWKRQLFFALGSMNFCRAILNKRSGIMHLVGQAHEVEVVNYLYVTLSRQINRLCDESWNVEKREHPTERARSWKDSFRKGAVVEIRNRLREEWAEFRDRSSESTALVFDRGAKVKEAFKGYYPHTGTHRSAPASNGFGFSGGKAAAGGMSLHRPVGGGNTGVGPKALTAPLQGGK